MNLRAGGLLRSLVVVAILASAVLAPAPVGAAATVPEVGVDAQAEMPDPTVVIDAGAYRVFGSMSLAVGTGRRVPMQTSSDLTSFTIGGDALAALPRWAAAEQVWAPGVARLGASWRLYYSARHVVHGRHCLSVATATSAGGPYVDTSVAPFICDDHGGDAIDPEPFIDDASDGSDGSGAPWLLWKATAGPGDSRPALWTHRLTADGLSPEGAPIRLLVGEQPWETPVIESPSMIRWRGELLLFYSGGTFIDERYAIGYARCESPAGPCSRVTASPLLRTGSGVVGPGGQSAFVDLRGRLRLAYHSWATATGGAERVRIRRLHVDWAVGPPGSLRVARTAFGALDEVVVDGATAAVRGWVIDPTTDGGSSVWSTAGAPSMGRTALADARRADVAAAYPGFGRNVGFSFVIPWNPNSRHACVYASGVQIGCRPGVAG